MKHLDKKHMMIIGGVVAVIVLYMYYRNSQSTASAPVDTTGTTASDPTGSQAASDYADLSGQIQSATAQEGNDVGTLSNQIAGVYTQEQTDVAALGTDYQNASTQEAGDVTALQGQNNALTGRLAKMVTSLNKDASSLKKQHQQIVHLQKGLKSAQHATRTPRPTSTRKGSKPSRSAVGHPNRGHVPKPRTPPKKHTAKR